MVWYDTIPKNSGPAKEPRMIPYPEEASIATNAIHDSTVPQTKIYHDNEHA